MKRRDWAEVPFQCWLSPVLLYIWWNQTDTKQPQAPWGVLLAGTWQKRGTKGSQAHGMSLDNLTTCWISARKSICQQGKEAGCCAVTELCRAWDPNHFFMHVTSPYGSKILHQFRPVVDIPARRWCLAGSMHVYRYITTEGNPLNIWKCSRSSWMELWEIWSSKIVLTHGRGVGIILSWKSLATQTILWIYDLWSLLPLKIPIFLVTLTRFPLLAQWNQICSAFHKRLKKKESKHVHGHTHKTTTLNPKLFLHNKKL